MSETSGESRTVATWELGCGVSPGDFLIGHLSGRLVGEQESIEDASVVLLSATFVEMGLEPEHAVDKAYDYLERGAALVWDGQGSLSFDFAKVETSDGSSTAPPVSEGGETQ